MALEKIVGIGSGTMGRGIAQVCAQAGIRIELKDAALELFDGTRETQKNTIADDLMKRGAW
jgi:3-hydroxyacyl-CoA dehydrogenase